ncbi:MAG TPA: WYL domain-containing protein [Candidatus Kapabacteria bacterium]|nr:WYL domain-containing protein [Candidatus Kapabacteria bacterium]
MRKPKPKSIIGTDQARRVIWMYNKFLEGNSYSSAEMYEEVKKTFKVDLSLRTVQRDLRILHEMVPNMEQVNVGRQVYWQLSKNALAPLYLSKIEANDKLGFYFLKAYLKQFKNSVISDDLQKLTKKIEKIAPGNLYIEESFNAIAEHGKFDYQNHNVLFEELVEAILNKQWLNIAYRDIFTLEVHHQFALFRGFFFFRGSIFFIAFVPRKHNDIAIPLENISTTIPAEPYNEYVPEFDAKSFFENRYGVSDGELIEVELKFLPEIAPIYASRQWHPKQEVLPQYDDSVIIKFPIIMNVEFVKWVMSIGKGLKILSPQVLIDMVKEQYQAFLSSNS